MSELTAAPAMLSRLVAARDLTAVVRTGPGDQQSATLGFVLASFLAVAIRAGVVYLNGEEAARGLATC